MSALELRDVAVSLGGRRVLHDVDLHLDVGEFVGLLGPNGAGKTTLLRAVLSLVASTGEIRVDGDTERPVRRGRTGIGYVPQRHEFAWDFPISVENVVMTGRRRSIGWLRHPRAGDHRAVAAALQRVGMSELRRRPVGQLSGGQRQRVLIARALASEPTVLLLDEPYTGLDMPTQETLSQLFVQLAGEGKAVLMTTHDLVGALDACQRIYLVNRTIVASGTPDELRDPQVWIDAFQVSPANPLIALLAAR